MFGVDKTMQQEVFLNHLHHTSQYISELKLFKEMLFPYFLRGQYTLYYHSPWT